MRKIILNTVVIATTLIASDITVKVTNILSNKGKVSIGLYNQNNDTFANISKAYKGINLNIEEKNVVYTFTNIPNGSYAIALFHDENENKKLDKNFLGMPKEGYGFSNNIRPTFRGANFDEAKFELNNHKNIIINMGY